ncbi:MAG: glutaredoxin family protein [Terrimicrobiaceae bacterium]
MMKLFIKRGCPWCIEAEDWLQQRGINYQCVDVRSDPAALEEMRRISGQTLAPTLLMPDGSVLADFDTGQLAAFLSKYPGFQG